MEKNQEYLQVILEKLDAMSQTLPKLMTTKEVAEYLNVKEQTLSLWRTAGTGPGYRKINKCVRYSIEDVKKYLNKQAVNC
ncbi:MAG: helix-turn-helix domain-containing protein [Proteobacteria bacterium]|nr:helix-turn-helix domain-containing protein [Pseudomonadota bacterium]